MNNTVHKSETGILHQKAEEALFNSESLYRSIFNASPDVITISDMEGRIKFTSPMTLKMFGYEDTAVLSDRPLLDFIDKKDYERGVAGITHMLQGNLQGAEEYTAVRADGSTFNIEIKGAFIKDSEGHNTSMVFIIRDISDRKSLQEEALKVSEEKNRTLIDNMGEGVGLLNDKEIFVFANPSAEKIFEVGKGELTGRSLNDFLLKENIELIKNETHIRSQGKSSTYEVELLLKDGGKKVILVTATPRFDDTQFTGTFGVFRDITERKKAEQTISMLTHVARSILECVTITDMTDKIIFVNSAFLKTYQYEEHELLGCPISMIRSQNNSPELVQGILPATLSGGWQGELLNIRKDGSEFPVYISSSVIRDENSKPLALIGVATDITARKQAEEKLELNNQELVKLHLEKDKFLSIIAHDLRGPFNGFLGLTNLMVEDLPSLTQKEIQKMAEGMRDSATNLLLLLENLLEWSRLQRGITSFEPESFLLIPMVTRAMRPVMDFANKKKIEISYEIPDHLEVFADQNLLASTIRNLATNAVKFTHKGGKVHLSARSVPGHSVEFSIRDTGMGMNSTMVDDLFRLDVQTSRRGTEDEPSSGLGLLLCKDFIEKHGGKIWVESVEGEGSIFYFTMPYNTEKQEQSAISKVDSAEDLTVQMKPLKILIAEDDYTSNFLITAILKHDNHEILHVKTGIEAIEVCRNNPDLNLILMDIRMPEMGGYEATRHIRQFNKDVIIIAQTAFGLSGDRQKAIDSGCNDYIAKPIIKDELLRLIQKHISGEGGIRTPSAYSL